MLRLRVVIIACLPMCCAGDVVETKAAADLMHLGRLTMAMRTGSKDLIVDR